MNTLNKTKRSVGSVLVEETPRTTARICDVVTVLKFVPQIEGSAVLPGSGFPPISCKGFSDEIWSFCPRKERSKDKKGQFGWDIYGPGARMGIKASPFIHGRNRNAESAKMFIEDLASRLQ
jgi:hypothetical protein